MDVRDIPARTLDGIRVGLIAFSLAQFSSGVTLAKSARHQDRPTHSPIEHVIVVIGENRSFDHVFATYVPKNAGTVNNLLSEGIIALDADNKAIPGPNFQKARQYAASDTDAFLLNPPKVEFPDNHLPAPLVGGPGGANGYFSGDNPCATTPPISPLECAQRSEAGLAGLPDYRKLVSGGTGQDKYTPDKRITDVEDLPAGPFQLTNGDAFPYDAYAASPVHRFYQMWQQLDCSAERATPANPSGCQGSLFSWVEVTIGTGSNGEAQGSNFSTQYSPAAKTTHEGSTALGFYNMQQGDAPYLKSLADGYAMSDNFHQSVDGGTGVNHIMFGHGDAIWFSDANGKPAVPPNGSAVFTAPYGGGANPDQGTVNEVENPNPAPGTNNWYAQDGYGASANAERPPPYKASAVYGGGSYSECSDSTQPGVREIVKYLASLLPPIDPHCEPGHYYLLNNYNPGWFGNGKNAYIDQNPANTPFTIPPSPTRSIGDDLNDHHISWKYYGDQWNNYVNDPYQINYGTNGPNADEYCNICNPFQYDTSIMSHPDQVAAHIQDLLNLYADIADHRLPAVSIVKPSGYVDGHPASSKLELFEAFTKKIVDQVKASPYAKSTAIFITFDEGGGYYDSGYVQPLDFFGDGTRVPMIVVSAYTKPGHISHQYADHVSILKFIERNWGIEPVTRRSRDNLPNPIVHPDNPYVPVNSPALGDLFDLFDFPHGGHLTD